MVGGVSPVLQKNAAVKCTQPIIMIEACISDICSSVCVRWFGVLALVKGVCLAARAPLRLYGLISVPVPRESRETWTHTHTHILSAFKNYINTSFNFVKHK